MASIQDENGFNQGFKPCKALEVRTQRRGISIIQEITNSNSDTLIIEIGCGTGDLAAFLAKNLCCNVIGVDISSLFIKEANKKHQLKNLNFICLNLSDESSWKYLKELKPDYLVGNGILHHLYYEFDSVLPKLKDTLNDNGKIIFWEPNLLNPYVYLIFKFLFFRRIANLEPDEMAFTSKDINQKLIAHGFSKARSTEKDFLLPNTPTLLIKPLILLSQLLEKIPIIQKLSQSVFVVGNK